MLSEGITKESPKRLIMMKSAKVQKGVSASAVAISRKPAPNTASPSMIGQCAGTRSLIRPETGNITAINRPAGTISRPARVAV